MSNPMSQLVLDLIKNITDVSKADGAEFSSSIKDNFEACSTFESYLTGIAEKQYVHCISRCLQLLAEDAQSSEIRPYLWNPIVASLIKCVGALAERKPYGTPHISKPPGNQSGSTRKPASVRTKTHPASKTTKEAKVSGNAQPQPPKRACQPTAELSAAVAKVNLEPNTGVETPCTSSAKVDPQLRLKAYAEVRAAREAASAPFFKQLKGGNRGEPVNCKVPKCAVCEKYFSLTPLTKCSDIRCHRPGLCTPSGWYPHVLPHIWATIKKAHVAEPNEEVRFSGLPGEQLPPMVTPSTVIIPLPKKRSWAQAAVGDSSDSDESITPKIMSPAWNGGSWSAQVEAEDCDFGDVCQ